MRSFGNIGWSPKHRAYILPTLSRITIEGPSSVSDYTETQYLCRADWSDGSHTYISPVWGDNSSYATITSAGVLQAGVPQHVTQTENVVITAIYGGKADTHSVNIQNVPVLSSLTISGPADVPQETTAQYVCTANYSDGTHAVVSPTWSESSPYATIDQNGLLTAESISYSDQSVTITAAFGGKIDTHAITIKLHSPEPFVTVWQTTEPNQTIGYKGPVGATGYSGTISVYDNTTNELLSTNEYTGPEDDVLWPVMANPGTYRIEILGSFPFIQADINLDDGGWA